MVSSELRRRRHHRHHHHLAKRQRTDDLTFSMKRDTGLLPAALPNEPLMPTSHHSDTTDTASALWLYIGITLLMTVVITLFVGLLCVWRRKRSQTRRNTYASHPWTARYMRTNLDTPTIVIDASSPKTTEKSPMSEKTASILFVKPEDTFKTDDWSSPVMVDYPCSAFASPKEKLSHRDDVQVALHIDTISFDHETAYSGLQSRLTSPVEEEASTIGLGLTLERQHETHACSADRYAKLMPRQSFLAKTSPLYLDEARRSNGSLVFLARAPSTMSMPSMSSAFTIADKCEKARQDLPKRASCADLLEEIFDEHTDANVTRTFISAMRSMKYRRLTRAIAATGGDMLGNLVRRSEIRRRKSHADALPAYMLESAITPYPHPSTCITEIETDACLHLENEESTRTICRTLDVADTIYVRPTLRRTRSAVPAMESSNEREVGLLRAQTIHTGRTALPSSAHSDRQMRTLAALHRQSEYASPTMQLVELYDDVGGDYDADNSLCFDLTSEDSAYIHHHSRQTAHPFRS